ncbi:hypothetical protein G5V59_20830 [Nocardioides sp. W3-2-3]|uniref:hypothetical protein n=1 Tax=Nocardioides convexus TaxID=2712224 RepID=UPI0024182E7E|nr:hypothetical protein [Nocardioides convexus]NHA01444.1 hypothetical protein [Nocardioides convexus]
MGNERAFLYLRSARSESIQTTEDLPPEVEGMGVFYLAIYEVDNDYRFPCPDSRYAVKPMWSDGEYSSPLRFPVFRPVDEDGAKAAQDAFFTTLKTNANLAYQQGVSLVGGHRGLLPQRVCPVHRGQPRDHRRRPGGPAAEHPRQGSTRRTTPTGPRSSMSRTSGPARVPARSPAFYDNFNSMLGRCYTFTCDVVAAFGMLAMLTHGAQVGAQKFAESVRDNLKTQSRRMGTAGRPAGGSADGAALDGGLHQDPRLGLGRGRGPAGGRGRQGAGRQVRGHRHRRVAAWSPTSPTSAGTSSGRPTRTSSLEGAEQIYTGLTDTLYSTYYEGYRSGLTQPVVRQPPRGPAHRSGRGVAVQHRPGAARPRPLKGAHQWSPGEVTHSGSMTEAGDDY